jgi:hypothetical protein
MGLGVLQSLSGIFRDQTVPCFCRGWNHRPWNQ